MKENIESIRNKIKLDNNFWKHILSTNCYAYALGIDIREKDIQCAAYQPGVLGNYLYSVNRAKQFTYTSLIESIFKDMERLGIEIREINPDEKVLNGEWKIALFTVFYAYEFYSEWLSDFHFLRQREDGMWYHKPGYYKIPTNKDYNGQIITNPESCYLGNKEFRKCYSLKLKR